MNNNLKHTLRDITSDQKMAFCEYCNSTVWTQINKQGKVYCKRLVKPRNFHIVTKVDWQNQKGTCSICGRCLLREKSTVDSPHCGGPFKNKEQHYLSEIDSSTMTAMCKWCNDKITIISVQNGTRFRCEAAYLNTLSVHSRHGLTLGEAREFVAGKNCEICDRSLDALKQAGGWRAGGTVDHDHDTGVLRGALCGRCNKAIGTLEDDINLLQSCINYLNKYRKG